MLNKMNFLTCSGLFWFDFAFQMLGCGGILKSSDPEKFVFLIAKSADSLLGKLFQKRIYSSILHILHIYTLRIHTLSQEARSCRP
jgi:short subunit fatty acids transporter